MLEFLGIEEEFRKEFLLMHTRTIGGSPRVGHSMLQEINGSDSLLSYMDGGHEGDSPKRYLSSELMSVVSE